MNVEQLISTEIPTLMPTDTGNRALAMMEENNVSELPVVSDENYVALVQESEVLDSTKPGAELGSADLLNYRPAIIATGHPFEALRLTHQMNLSVLPVINSEHKYIGAVTRDGLLKYFTENSGIDTPGGIVVLEVSPRDYTLVEIARICENEDVTIMNVQVHANEQGKLEVTLKLNRTVVEAVVASLERFNYVVKEVYGENMHSDDIEGKYHLLMNYINM